MTMRSQLRVVAASIGAFLLTAASATAQLLEEQGAYAGVDRAVAAFNGASDRASMLRAAEQALDAAEGALNAFRTADRVRDAASDRYLAANREIGSCQNGYYRCDASGNAP